MVPSLLMAPKSPSPRNRRALGTAAAIVLSLGLLLGACSSGSKAAGGSTNDPTTTSIPASPYVSSFATAKNKTLTVYTSPPPGVSATTTTVPSLPVPPIPRAGLNSAGVKKVNEGIEFTNPTYHKNPLVVQVLANQGDWLRVLVTARPNHTEGWVRADDVVLGATDYRMELDLSTYTLRVYKAAEVFLETTVAIGKDSTPSPMGRYYVTEIIKNASDKGIYGAFILPINGYSEVLDSFDGGLPQVAFHGTNQPELLGSKASNGCVRMDNEAVTKIAENIPAGTPVEIFATTPAQWKKA